MKTPKTCLLCGSTQFTALYKILYGYSLKQCKACGLVQLVPLPSYRVVNQVYQKHIDQFTSYTEQLPIHTEYLQWKVEEMRKKHRHNSNHIRILDVGCALGALLQAAKDAGFQATGIDVSKEAVDYCRRHGYHAVRGTLGGLMSRGQLPVGGYDFVSGFEVIEHEHKPLEFARYAYRLLKKGGLLVLSTPDHDGPWCKVMKNRWFQYTNPEHVVFFGPDTMRKLLTKAGFTDITVRREKHRNIPMYTAFKRLADFSPGWLAPIFIRCMRVAKVLKLKNPVNPWDEMIIWA
ncbi:hypothetical protein A2Z00_03905, partial [Candidatus Gottesmanbacteria bacterium RBG_13_45_10]